MPARLPIFIQNGVYHVYNRGHNKQLIFHHFKDYQRYLKRLREYLEKHPVKVLAYCLMPNHIHLLLKQTTDESIERFIHRLHTAYTMYFNKKYERVGSVFQGRFKAKLVDTDEYLLHLSRYIHLNPLELHVQGPALNSYPWSSFGEYTWSRSKSLTDPSMVLAYFESKQKNKKKKQEKYREFVESMIPRMSSSLLEDISTGNV